MIEVRPVTIGPITTEGFKPTKEDRSSTANFQLGRLMVAFYGGEAIRWGKALTQGNTFTRTQAEAIDTHFFGSSQQIYNLPTEMPPQRFYMDQNSGAIAAVQHFATLVPELASFFELKREVKLYSDSPSDLLEKLCSIPVDTSEDVESDPNGPNIINKRLHYEIFRHAMLNYQLGLINVRTLNSKLRTVSSYIQNLLNDRELGIYEGPEGSGKDTSWDSYHDDNTNEVVGYPGCGPRPLTAHIKRIGRTVRRVKDVGIVYADDRKKDDNKALFKSWEKALMNGGTIHLDNAVQDSIGLIFVLMEDTIKPRELADMVAEVIRSGTERRVEADHRKQLPRVTKIEPDDITDADRGQSCAPPFNARRKLWFEGIPTPVELIFSDRTTYLNSQYEVGTRDPKTGLYMGRAHELFELRRARNAVRLMFPQGIYEKLDDHTLTNGFINASKRIAYRLSNMDR